MERLGRPADAELSCVGGVLDARVNTAWYGGAIPVNVDHDRLVHSHGGHMGRGPNTISHPGTASEVREFLRELMDSPFCSSRTTPSRRRHAATGVPVVGGKTRIEHVQACP